jgi:hypothetical protein
MYKHTQLAVLICLLPAAVSAQNDSIVIVDHAPKTFIAADLHSNLIELQTYGGVISIAAGFEAVGLTGINNPQLKNTLELAMTNKGLNPNLLHIRKCKLEEVLAGAELKNIHFVPFPEDATIDALLLTLSALPMVRHVQEPVSTVSTGGISYTDTGWPNSPLPNWHISNIQAPNSWVFMQDLGATPAGILEIQAGVDGTYQDLVGNVANYLPSDPDDNVIVTNAIFTGHIVASG